MENKSKPRVIAFYLPQFHPIPENDEWWGKGFTEWTNTAKAKPLFLGHYQPKVPADLGFYDLRLKEVQLQQIELAKISGIEGFCYYHYWFGNGKQLMEKPIQNVLANKDLDFPFCFCWANHDWAKQDWNNSVSRKNKTILIKQEYPGEQDIYEHFYSLLPYFKDQRYVKVNAKPVFVIFDIEKIPNFDRMKNIWNELAKKELFQEIFFVGCRREANKLLNSYPYNLCNGNAIEMLLDIKRGTTIIERFLKMIRRVLLRMIGLPEFLYNYKKIYHKLISDEIKNENVYPVLVPNFDHSPRRGKKGLVFFNSTPENFKLHIKDTFDRISQKDHKENFVFLKSWNEWGEGNYIEPDLKYGHGYIDVLKEILNDRTL
jgi:hypothetical protein